LTLLKPVCSAIAQFLREGEHDGQKGALTSLARVARALAESPAAAELFELTATAVETFEETENLDAAFQALRRIFKFCYRRQQSFFLEKAVGLITKVMLGDIAIMNGRSAPVCPALAPLIQPLMGFLGDVFAAGPSGVEPVCDSLLEWLATVNETDRFSLIGALSDAIEYCPVEDCVISAICNYFSALPPNDVCQFEPESCSCQ
jgi:hypothetical protein